MRSEERKLRFRDSSLGLLVGHSVCLSEVEEHPIVQILNSAVIASLTSFGVAP